MSAIPWDEYRCPLGFLSGKRFPKESSGNAILFSAHERLLRTKLGDWDFAKQSALVDRVTRYLEIKPGLIRRPPPFKNDTESMDNYVGYAAISIAYAVRALDFGERSFYRPFWPLKLAYHYPIDGNEKDIRAWLGRYPTLVAYFKDCLCEDVTLPRRLAWAASVALSGDGSSQDPWILNWHLLEAEGGRSRLGRIAIRTYWRRLAHHWPGGLASIFGEYLDDYKHPIVLACENLKLGKAALA